MFRIVSAVLLLVAAHAAQAFPTYASGNGFRGANLMTPEERKEHVAKLQAMQTYPQCEAYMAAHEEVLQQRAKAQNVVLPPKGGNPCTVMRVLGRIR